jgi:hypothetical protein
MEKDRVMKNMEFYTKALNPEEEVKEEVKEEVIGD